MWSIEEDNTSFNDNVLSCNITVNIDYSNEAPIKETISIQSTKETELKELTKIAVEKFNTVFDNKHMALRFKTDSLDYKLIPSSSNKQIHITTRTKISEFEFLEFALEYNPQDILINFPKNQRKCCCGCILV